MKLARKESQCNAKTALAAHQIEQPVEDVSCSETLVINLVD